MLTAEQTGEIYRLFTEEPEGGLPYAAHELRRSVDPIEERRLLREWATTRLVAAAILESEVVVDLLGDIFVEKPFNAFGLGINIVRRLQSEGYAEPAVHISEVLAEILDDDQQSGGDEKLFTDFDRQWLEGNDLDYMDEENLVLYLLWKTFDERERGAYAKGSLFGVGRRRSGEKGQVGDAAEDVQDPDIQRIRSIRDIPRSSTTDANYDVQLQRLAIKFEKLYGYAGVMRLVAAYPPRTETMKHNIGLIIDMSVHSQAVRKLGVVNGGSVQAALDYINSIPARTTLGRNLFQAFRVRVTKDG